MFDISQRITVTAIPAPGTEAQLMDCAARFFIEQLDRDRPAWRLRLLFGLE